MKPRTYLLIAAALILLALVWHNSRRATWIKRIKAKYPNGDAKSWTVEGSPWSLKQLVGMYFAGHPALEAPQLGTNTTRPDSAFAKNPDGSTDYSHFADGSAVQFG